MGLESRLTEYVSFSGELMAKWYDGAPDRSLTGGAGMWLNAMDFARFGFGYRRSEEYVNGYALDQDIQSDRVWAALEANPWRRLNLRLGYEQLIFSDDNQQRLVEGAAKLLLTDHPYELALEGSLTHRHTTAISEYVYDDERLTDIIHPYWTPQNYLAAVATLRWRHDLSDFLFCGAQKHHYELALSAGTDTNDNPYVRGSLAWHWEFLEHWTWDLEAMLHQSRQWEGRSLNMGLAYRF